MSVAPVRVSNGAPWTPSGQQSENKMKNLPTSRLASVLVVIGTVCSCAAYDDASLMTTSSMRAVCASQGYLRANGYLDYRPEEVSQIQLELWDRIRYETDGQMDWSSLLNDRHRTYSEKLYGVTKQDQDFLVLYRLEFNFSCVRVSPDLDVHLHEAPCRPSRWHIRRIDERELTCS